MTQREFEALLKDLHITIDDAIGGVTNSAQAAQSLITKAVIASINTFELTDGRFVASQDYAAKFAALERKMNGIIGREYLPAVKDYLPTFKTIEETTVGLQRSFNQVRVDLDLISPARKAAYESTAFYLRDALKDAYVQPAKFVLAQQVTAGAGLQDTVKLLERWDKEGLPKELNAGRQTPNLNQYATQLARDSMYKYQGVINERIAGEYGLTSFLYVGGVIESSRPLCRHLVGLKRKIKLDEMPKLIKQFPEGLYPDTSAKNFIAVCGGFSCRHSANPVRE